MRIALVHSFYSSQQPSGENRVVEHQAELLAGAGHAVEIVGRSTDECETSPLYRTRTTARVASGIGANPLRRLEQLKPDIVHIHNLFPNFATRWVRSWGGPSVVTLHNYRSVCSRADLYRQGHYCQECVDFGDHRAIVHACYRNSRLATLPVAVSRASFQRDVLQAADAIVTTSTPSDALLQRLFDGALRTTVIPNPGSDTVEGIHPVHARSGWIAMGRFTEEKGFTELVHDWPHGESLSIVGSGPLESELKQFAIPKSISIEPSMPIGDLREYIGKFKGLIFPSRWIEVAPQVVVEAMQAGLPVIAYEANGVSELVAQTGTGLAYRDSHSLEQALIGVTQDLDRYSSAARNYYRSHWTAQIWLESITRLYDQILSARSGG